MELNHTSLFHEALTKAHDIAKNGTRNTAAWNDLLETVDAALAEARRLDAEVEAKWPSPKRMQEIQRTIADDARVDPLDLRRPTTI